MSDRELIAAAQALIDGDRAEAWRYPTVWEPLVDRLKIAAQAQAQLNQQLLESREIKPYMSDYEQGCVDGWNNYRDAIAAAQEQGGGE